MAAGLHAAASSPLPRAGRPPEHRRRTRSHGRRTSMPPLACDLSARSARRLCAASPAALPYWATVGQQEGRGPVLLCIFFMLYHCSKLLSPL